MRSIAQLHARLKSAGHSRTAARDAVFMALEQYGPATKHAVAVQLAGRVDQSSVYRTINLFLAIGVADLIRFHLIELSDSFKQHHHHFICNSCGQETGFNDERLERLISQLAASHELVLTDHQIELAGLCKACAGAPVSSST